MSTHLVPIGANSTEINIEQVSEASGLDVFRFCLHHKLGNINLRPARPVSITRSARGEERVIRPPPLAIGSWGTQKHQIWWVVGTPEFPALCKLRFP